ncbi:hypothetical protein Bca4012_083451 [Brassica carinata]
MGKAEELQAMLKNSGEVQEMLKNLGKVRGMLTRRQESPLVTIQIFVISFAKAYDLSPLQDFCVAIGAEPVLRTYA